MRLGLAVLRLRALSPPLACNKETRRSLAGGLPRVSLSLLSHLQGDKPRRSVSLQLAPPVNGELPCDLCARCLCYVQRVHLKLYAFSTWSGLV